MRTVPHKLTAVVAIVLFALALGTAGRTPSDDRDWEAGLAHAPVFDAAGESAWTLRNLRAFEFDKDGSSDGGWRDTAINAGDLEAVWFFVEPFDGFDGAAHTLISFVFGGATDQTIAISVEARKEKGETYSGLDGVFNSYELIYLWSSEKDVLTRIAVSLDHEIFAYRLDVTPAQARQILTHFIARTNALNTSPRFYNTLVSNCTNELAKAVNSAFPGALPWHYSHVLTGYAAQRLHALGFIDGDAAPFSDIKSAARASDAIRAARREPETLFSAAWRTQLATPDR